MSNSNTSDRNQQAQQQQQQQQQQQPQTQQPKEVVVETSINDKRQFRYLTLGNELEVLLISHAQSEKAAASMDVHGIGYFRDPANLPGLAHFLEHMLFLGNDKYPEEDQYQGFLKQYGGSSNAFTAGENTNYFFDVLPECFPEALDMFSNFFISPLFTESATMREMKAVDSENAKNLQSDPWRANQLLRSTANSGHPFSKYGTGNLTTLHAIPTSLGINVREEMKKFYETFYSAHVMSLCVLSPEPLDFLEALVREKFSNIRNIRTDDSGYKQALEKFPFPHSILGHVIKSVPVNNIHTLTLMFPTPTQLKYYESKPHHVLSNLLGHEGPGSVLWHLKSQSLATSLATGTGVLSSYHDMISVEVALADGCVGKWAEVAQLVFQYVAVIVSVLKSEPNVMMHHYQELKALGEISFRFAESVDEIRDVCSLAGRLREYPASRILSGPALTFEPSLEDLSHILTYIVPENVIVHLSSKTIAGQTNLVEPNYSTDYSIEALDISSLQNLPANPALHLPAPNDFIPSRFDLLPATEMAQWDELTPPRIHTLTPRITMYHRPDVSYNVPKAAINLELLSEVAYSSPRNAVLASLTVVLLEDSLIEYTYAAEVAGLKFGLQNIPRGVIFRVSGYNDKIQILLERILERLMTLVVTPERFQMFKQELELSYSSFHFQSPQGLAFYLRAQATENPRWHIDQYIPELKTLTVSDLTQWLSSFTSSLSVVALLHGNVGSDQCDKISHLVQRILNLDATAPPKRVPVLSVVDLPSGPGCHVLLQNVLNPKEKNSACLLHYQIGPENARNDVLLDLLQQVIDEKFRQRLRTEEQLGYVVACVVDTRNKVRGLDCIVMSSVMVPHNVHVRIHAFMSSAREILESLSDHDFQKHVDSQKRLKLEKDRNLARRSGRYWGEIYSRSFQFNRAIREVEELTSVTKDDLLAFYDKHFSNEHHIDNKRRFAVYLVSKNTKPAAPQKPSPPAISDAHPESVSASSESGSKNAFEEQEKFLGIKYVEDVHAFKTSLPLHPGA